MIFDACKEADVSVKVDIFSMASSVTDRTS